MSSSSRCTMSVRFWVGLLTALALFSGQVQAQVAEPANVLSLSARASAEATYDVLTITLSTTRQGPDAAAVQRDLKQAVDGALSLLRPMASGQDLSVRTGAFSLSPRYLRDGQTDGWQGSAEVVLEGRDLAKVADAAGRVKALTVAQVHYSLSPELREEVEAQVSGQAIERFRAKATASAKQFGFTGYTLREVMLSSDQEPPVRPMLRTARAEMAMSADAPIPVEAGRGSVTVTVSGSIVLR